MNPYNILCLTFTESAAHEMRERLVKIIGTSAYDVVINTFHGFANSIIKEFPYTFNSVLSEEGDDELIDLKPLDDFGRFELIKKLLTQNHWSHLTPLKNNLIHLNQFSRHLQDFKRERITPQYLMEKSLGKIKEIHLFTKDEKLTKTKKSTLDVELQKAKRTLELVELYKLYNLELLKNHYYDYEDMINWVVDALGNDPELALIYQEKFQYILVDEFQDTNNAQLELLNQLTSFYKNNPNLFVVGDPNQSIYRFQGASNYNLEQYKKRYKNAQEIELDISYRSGQKIIQTAKKIIENNQPSIDIKPNIEKKSMVSVNKYLHKEQELYGTAQKIKRLIEQKTVPSEIAILVRRNDQINDFIRALTQEKIPFQVVRGGKVLGDPIIEKIILLLEVLVDPSDKYKFSQLCYFFREDVNFKDADIIKNARLKNKEIKGLSTNAKNFLQKLQETARKISELPLPVVVSYVFNEFAILRDTLNSSNRLEKLQLLKAFYNASKIEVLSLPRWIEKLRAMQLYNLDLQNEPILYGEEDAVVISTVHQAKGKEYEIVFLPQLQQNIWSKSNRSIFYIPDLNVDLNENEIQIQEERRLFYVGLTRAKTNIYFSYADYDNEKEITKSRYVEELPKDIIASSKSEKSNDVITRISQQIAPVGYLTLSQLESAWLKDIVSKQPLSPTGFTKYKQCPKNYLIENVLRIPQVKSPSLSYGSAIHKALENYFLSYQKNSIPPDLEELLGYYKNAVDEEKHLTEIENKKYLTDGTALLTAYHNTRSQNFQIPIKTEYSFNQVNLDGIPLTGKVDKIEWIDPNKKTVRVIDYKTGRVKSRNALLGQTKAKDTDYMYQLKFYQLLSQLDHKFYLKWKIGESVLEFLDNDKKFAKESFIFNDNEIDDLKQEIKVIWQDIQDLKFQHNTNAKYDCKFCNVIN